ncbi:MAG TPA: ABC transporter permease [Spirochaetia bacterium]|nr:ABC transporter permease [Spirochaetia bacterium]
MRNALSIARRIILQISMDRRTLALILVAPVVMITLLWVVINGGLTTPNIALVGDPPAALRKALNENAKLIVASSSEEGLALVRSQRADALLDYTSTPPELIIDGANPSVTGLVGQVIQRGTTEMMASNPIMKRIVGNLKPEVKLLHGSLTASAFDFLAPVMMGFVIFFFIFILSGISFLRERVSGTLERIFSTPARPIELSVGYMLGFGFFAALQTVFIQLFMIEVLKTPAHGSFFAILLVNLSLCLAALSMGSLISAFAQSEFQVMQFIPIVILPQVLFSGILDLRQAPHWVRLLSYIFPLTYGGQALRDLMLRGDTLAEVWPNLAIVLGFALLFLALNTLALRKVRS